MEDKAIQGENKELRTSFNAPQFMSVLETLKAAQEAIESLASRYDEGDKKRETLNKISDTIKTDFYNLLSEVVGSDFVECTLNIFKQR